jgi:hypothetical protein
MLAETLVYVARGQAVVKIGKYDDKCPEFLLKQGNICNLSILLGENTGDTATTYACGNSKCSIIPFGNSELR